MQARCTQTIKVTAQYSFAFKLLWSRVRSTANHCFGVCPLSRRQAFSSTKIYQNELLITATTNDISGFNISMNDLMIEVDP